MSRALIVVNTDWDRQKAAAWAGKAPWGTRIEFKGPKRTLDQNSLFWALLTEVATQLPWHGKKLTADSWKLMFLDALKRSKNEPLDIVPNTDDTGFVNLSTSSSDLSKEEMTEMIELIYAFGAKHNVRFHEPSDTPPRSDDEAGPLNPSGGPANNSNPAAAGLEAGESETRHGAVLSPANAYARAKGM